MTKEELEKEAEKYWIDQPPFTEIRDRVVQAYIDSAEPREKQIQIDAEQIRALQKQNGELTDKVKELEQKLIEADNATDVFNAQEKRIAELTDELKALRESIKDYGAGCYENGLSNGRRKLEAQIDKMKRCEICKHYQGESCNYHSNWVKDCKENGMKLFELKEIKEK